MAPRGIKVIQLGLQRTLWRLKLWGRRDPRRGPAVAGPKSWEFAGTHLAIQCSGFNPLIAPGRRIHISQLVEAQSSFPCGWPGFTGLITSAGRARPGRFQVRLDQGGSRPTNT